MHVLVLFWQLKCQAEMGQCKHFQNHVREGIACGTCMLPSYLFPGKNNRLKSTHSKAFTTAFVTNLNITQTVVKVK